METKDLDEKVEKILATRTVGKAQQIMESESGVWLVAAVSFIESALPVPILTDPFLIAAIMLNRSKTGWIIFTTTAASVLGGITAFFTAAFFLSLLEKYLSPEISYSLALLSAKYSDSDLVISLVGAITPVPYTSAAWAVALIGGNLLVFIAASIFGRGLRYLIVGLITYHFGPKAVMYAKRSIGLTSVVVFILVGLYIWHKM